MLVREMSRFIVLPESLSTGGRAMLHGKEIVPDPDDCETGFWERLLATSDQGKSEEDLLHDTTHRIRPMNLQLIRFSDGRARSTKETGRISRRIREAERLLEANQRETAMLLKRGDAVE